MFSLFIAIEIILDGPLLNDNMPTLAHSASSRSVEMGCEIPFQLWFSYPDRLECAKHKVSRSHLGGAGTLCSINICHH